MKKGILLIALALAALAAGAEEKVVFDKYPSALGLYVDSAAVYGLSYQRWMGDFGFQTALSVQSNTWTDGTFDASAVIEGKYRLYSEDYAAWLSGALYLAALAGGGYSRNSSYVDGGSYALGEPLAKILFGAGLGFEVVLFRHFSMDLQFLYRTKYETILDIGLGAGFGVTYRF